MFISLAECSFRVPQHSRFIIERFTITVAKSRLLIIFLWRGHWGQLDIRQIYWKYENKMLSMLMLTIISRRGADAFVAQSSWSSDGFLATRRDLPSMASVLFLLPAGVIVEILWRR